MDNSQSTSGDMMTIQKWLDEYQKNEYANKNEDCPHCGRCKHCGRGGYGRYPAYPWYSSPYTPHPYNPRPTWTISSSNYTIS